MQRQSQAANSNFDSPSPGGSYENRHSVANQMNSRTGDKDEVVESPESPEKEVTSFYAKTANKYKQAR